MDRLAAKVAAVAAQTSTSAIDEKQLRLGSISLRPYQIAGINWLLHRQASGSGALLGDEMGLGKTLTSVGFLAAHPEKIKPSLVLVPLSVLSGWRAEFAHASHLKVLVYIGDKEERQRLWLGADFDVCLTSFEMALRDAETFAKMQWKVLIVDEAHRLKNAESQLHKTLLHDISFDFRLLLTGTPVQNNLTELYSLLSFIEPAIFKSGSTQEQFLEKYQDLARKDVDFKTRDELQSSLHHILSQFMLRRTKQEVLASLPEKSEVFLYAGMTALQKKYYQSFLMKDLSIFDNASKTSNKLLNTLMQLRKVANHPYLFDGVEPEPFECGDHLHQASGKLSLLDSLLTYLKPKGHRVLIFSQMTRMLDIIQDFLTYRGHTYERLDGSVRGEERFVGINKFMADDDTFVFLLSTKAGGVGLNLQGADTVIFYDSDFNPQNDLQAAARAHRIGQTRPVKIIRLLTRNTVEEVILRRAEFKLQLTKSVIESGQFIGTDSDSTSLKDAAQGSIAQMLKFGVDKLLQSPESMLEDTDLDAMLGPSSDGKWATALKKIGKEPADVQAVREIEAKDMDEPDNIYLYMGEDYSKIRKEADDSAFEMLAEQARDDFNASLSLRSTAVASTATALKRKRELTEEEKEILKEAREKRAKLAEEARNLKEEQRELKREERIRRAAEVKLEMWKNARYVSTNLPLAEEEPDNEEEEVEIEEEDAADLEFMIGDVSKPPASCKGPVIIAHVVDGLPVAALNFTLRCEHDVADSGSWGTGGLFNVLSRLSPQVEITYTTAAQMDDLAIGDTHLIKLDLTRPDESAVYVALFVAQSRDRHNRVTGIDLASLDQCLRRAACFAKQNAASIHMPRIGHATRGFNWYGTERLIRKRLCRQGVPSFVYYFSRHQKPQPGSLQQPDRPDPPAPQQPASSVSPELPDVFSGENIYFYGVPDDETKRLRRLVIAFDGDVCTTVGPHTTRIITPDGFDASKCDDLLGALHSGKIKVETVAWIDSKVKPFV